MLKYNYGHIGDDDLGKEEVLNIPVVSRKSLKTLLIGGTIMAAGALYIWLKSFKDGADAYDNEEWRIINSFKMLEDLKS